MLVAFLTRKDWNSASISDWLHKSRVFLMGVSTGERPQSKCSCDTETTGPSPVQWSFSLNGVSVDPAM